MTPFKLQLKGRNGEGIIGWEKKRKEGRNVKKMVPFKLQNEREKWVGKGDGRREEM